MDPDPDQTTQINADPCGSGSETLVLGLFSDIFYKFSLQSNLCICYDENYLLILQKEHGKILESLGSPKPSHKATSNILQAANER
jgi:hypothetical protein